MKKSYLRKVGDAAVLGGVSAVLVTGLLGCSDSGSDKNAAIKEAAKQQGVMVKLQEQEDGSYKILDEMPTSDGSTTIVVRNVNGEERILSKEEVDALVAEEAKKIDNGTSTLTSGDGGGLGIGGAILASAAGALIGSYIGNKLFGNSNFKAAQQRGYSSPSAYQRSQSMGANRATSAPSSTARSATPSNAKSGFFGGSNAGGSSSSSATSASS
ncbi:hypothetical protein DCO58_09575 [Helicobacter saguini]|uniref:UPF0323 domain-containing protein n=1 Tax=Helicobacter saguini TaxID=1548018 RepID=A0A347VPB4_9HELI|nr:UPF0323 family lipoprotein [Helicobacter saguini]MWV61434.1 hypothetical protein [Helicobacter saguini]MWV67896.1 hypothetical protein [Helicobacter saguini]MWV70636.1 hypothetical protein [Helicobacter saguini]MWV72540.1 hypothetical protein [Helicobacter saguini]TLD94722.1 hypothetical protein LS64_004160 [Helicobacter saguini]